MRADVVYKEGMRNQKDLVLLLRPEFSEFLLAFFFAQFAIFDRQRFSLYEPKHPDESYYYEYYSEEYVHKKRCYRNLPPQSHYRNYEKYECNSSRHKKRERIVHGIECTYEKWSDDTSDTDSRGIISHDFPYLFSCFLCNE